VPIRNFILINLWLSLGENAHTQSYINEPYKNNDKFNQFKFRALTKSIWSENDSKKARKLRGKKQSNSKMV